jgi:hypothetical protein
MLKFTATEVSAELSEFDVFIIFLGNKENYFMLQYEEGESR